ncbi:glucose-6-phosphate isomerase [Metamycoplasma buccale]|uniref:glucose-6-phosphate isomerase n=1 Tax=Metamycoplasma buccale TaxID=55602 RepID=UPI00398F2606
MVNKILLDINYALKQEALKKYQNEITEIAKKIEKYDIEGHEFFGFKDPYKSITKDDYSKIKKISKQLIESNVEVLVVIASKHICLQSESLIELASGLKSNDAKLEILYVNENINGRDIAQLASYLDNKSFAINVISQSGENAETLILFNEIRHILENKLGKTNAAKYIYVSTNNNYGKLFTLVKDKGYQHFIIFDNSTEKYFSFSAATLFPLACANIDIDKFLNGAANANQVYSKDNLDINSAYAYAVARKILHDNKYNLESINVFGNSFYHLGELFKMYLAESSVKNKRGILPILNLQSSDIKTFGESLIGNEFKCFETNIIINKPKYDYRVAYYSDPEDYIYNQYSNLTYNKIANAIGNTIIENHVILYKIPNIKVNIADDNDETLGWIVTFIHRASIMSAYLFGFNPFINEVHNSYNVALMKELKDISGGKDND